MTQEGDEVTEQLRGIMAFVAVTDAGLETMGAELDRLRARVEKLEVGLRMFVDMPEQFPEAGMMEGWARMKAAFANAKQLLT